MMLGPRELEARQKPDYQDQNGRIIIVPSPQSTGTDINGAAAIDLRLGRWFLSLQQSRTDSIDLTRPREAEELEAREGKLNYVPFGSKFIIHPGRFVLASTIEWIKVPAGLGGHITGRSSIGRRGLVIETAAGLHPHFSGCITLELSNCGEVPIIIVPGIRICQVFFHKLDGIAEENPGTFSGRRRPTFGPYKLDKFVAEAARAVQHYPDQGNLL